MIFDVAAIILPYFTKFFFLVCTSSNFFSLLFIETVKFRLISG